MMQIETTQPQINPYILGHSYNELNRLIHRARFFGDLSDHVLRLAGLEPGMSVLDVGCGAGDVSFLAASIVGPEGEVIGVDRSNEAIEVAGERAAKANLRHVHFITWDIADLTLEKPVDALIGRLVLMYFADPAVILRRLSEFLKVDGLVVSHEIDSSTCRSEPACHLLETAIARINRTFTHTGADIRTGLKLSQIFQEAGLPRPQMILGARVENGPHSEAYSVVEQLMRSPLPWMERTGVATATEVGIETLADGCEKKHSL